MIVPAGESWGGAVGVDPCGDVGGVEAEEVAPLDVGDAAFVDEAADVADVDTEGVGDFGDGEQARAEWRSGPPLLDIEDRVGESLPHVVSVERFPCDEQRGKDINKFLADACSRRL